jgi:steroid delta-isomerase-like uncharacterized protein
MKSGSFYTCILCLLFLQSCNSQPKQAANGKSSGAMMLENRFSNEVVGKQNADLLNEILGDDFVSHHFPEPGMNDKTKFIAAMRMLLKSFPDIHIVRNEQYEKDDRVFTYAYWEGTHKEAFMGIPPTGKKVHVEYMDIWRVKDGKIRENWVVMDILGLLIQLGAVPPPGK